MKPIDASIVDFYNNSNEDTRLQTGLGPLEFERNKLLITRHLGDKNLTIADVGGGSGHYSAWLSEGGHQVSLIDPVLKHIIQAQKKAKKSKSHFQCIQGEAAELPFTDATIDVVILHGPLYHLQRSEDRMAALREAKRVLKPNGVVLGFAITHAASSLAALHSGMLFQPIIFDMCREELTTSRHEPPQNMPGMLASAYFHRPSVLNQEFKQAGFNNTELFAVEGMAWMDATFFQNWNNPQLRPKLMELISLTENDPELLCLSPHMMIAAKIDH